MDIGPPPEPDDDPLLELDEAAPPVPLALDDEAAPPVPLALDDAAPPALAEDDDASPPPEDEEELVAPDELAPVSPPPQPATPASKSGSSHIEDSERPRVVVTDRFMMSYPVEISA